MRVLEVMAGAPDGGAEIAFVDSCIAFAEAGVTIEVVTRSNNAGRLDRLTKAGLMVHILPFGGAIDFITPWLMRRIIRRFRPDIVQTWMSRAGQKAPRWRPGGQTPRYVVFSRLGNYYKLRHFPATDYFITITPAIKIWLEQQGVADDKVRHINNFAETEDNAEPASRAVENTPADAPLLVALGRLHTAKAFDVLIDAMALLPDVYLWIAGEGPERQALEARIKDLGLEARVRLLGWRNDRAGLLKTADICVFPSRYEPFGTVFVQAWASRTPLVTTEADGPRQFVRDGEDGLVVPIEDADALAKAIRHLADDKNLAMRLAEKGFERYMNEFAREKTVAAYLEFYRYALDKIEV